MKKIREILFADKIIRAGFWISVSLVFLSCVLIGIVYINLPPLLPVYNQMPWGETRLGMKYEIFYPILIAIVFYIVNMLFGLYIYNRMPLVSRTLCITGLLLIVMAFIFTLRTIQLIY